MRISTSQIFNSGANGIGRNQSDLFKLQNQMSTGRRVLTPADDPIGSSCGPRFREACRPPDVQGCH